MNVEHPDELARDPLPLRGRRVLVTGVSRRAGIGYATACRPAAYGASVFCHHHAPHDAEQPWGGDDLGAVLDGVRSHLVSDARLADAAGDLADPTVPARVVDAAVAEFGGIDALVCNQARSGGDGRLRDISAADLDAHWAVNARLDPAGAGLRAAAPSGGAGVDRVAHVGPGAGADAGRGRLRDLEGGDRWHHAHARGRTSWPMRASA
ncbi:NAD(P)-dependent dehydrogenase (short-subunit alcohol dehydrogenase family) [Pseudoclavibacter chungangensis]|nr:NAD(P)-dependent dehydrogenase (short-subunit alcohol dehydrogenase family) [Pseudoclavibacter chungangensis]